MRGWMPGMRKTLPQKVAELRRVTGGSEVCGWMNDEVCWLLYGLVRFFRPSLVIQTGHLWGKSALVVLEALKNEPLDKGGMGDFEFSTFVEKNSPPKVKGRLISVDPGSPEVPNPDAGYELLAKWYPNFTHVGERSRSFFKDFQAEDERIFAIVDGDHSPNGAQGDLLSVAELGAVGIFLDDTSWLPHLQGLPHELGDYESLQFPEYNGVTLLRRKW